MFCIKSKILLSLCHQNCKKCVLVCGSTTHTHSAIVCMIKMFFFSSECFQTVVLYYSDHVDETWNSHLRGRSGQSSITCITVSVVSGRCNASRCGRGRSLQYSAGTGSKPDTQCMMVILANLPREFYAKVRVQVSQCIYYCGLEIDYTLVESISISPLYFLLSPSILWPAACAGAGSRWCGCCLCLEDTSDIVQSW